MCIRYLRKSVQTLHGTIQHLRMPLQKAYQLPRSIASSIAASNISITETWTKTVPRGMPSGYLD